MTTMEDLRAERKKYENDDSNRTIPQRELRGIAKEVLANTNGETNLTAEDSEMVEWANKILK